MNYNVIASQVRNDIIFIKFHVVKTNVSHFILPD